MGILLNVQDKNRNAVYDESDHGHKDGLIERNLHGIHESFCAFQGHHERKNAKQHRSRETTEGINLTRAKAEFFIESMASGER